MEVVKTRPAKQAVACAPCKGLKKRCSGAIPCERCVSAGVSHQCVPSQHKRPGRRRAQPSSASGAVAQADGHLLLSMLLSHGHVAVASRPGTLASALGLDPGPNYLVVRVEHVDVAAAPVALYEQCTIVSSHWDGALAGFAAALDNGVVTWAHNRRLREIMTPGCVAARQQDDMRGVFDAAEADRPHARVFDVPFPSTMTDAKGHALAVRTRLLLFFDERAALRYIFIALMGLWDAPNKKARVDVGVDWLDDDDLLLMDPSFDGALLDVSF